MLASRTVRLLTAGSGLLALLTLDGCDRSPDPPLRLGATVWAGNYGLHVAAERHFTDPHPVRILTFPSATDVIRALMAGQLDVACITADEFLLTALQTGPMAPKAILVIDISLGADAILVKPPARTMADLRGRRVGVESTALGALMLARALQLNGLQRTDITVAQVPYFDQERQFREGRIDAVVTYEPVRSRLVAAGAVEVFSSRQIPGEVMDLLVATPAAIRNRGPALRALVAGYYRARAFGTANGDSARQQLSRYLRIPAERVDSVLAGVQMLDLPGARAMLGPGPDGLAARLARLAETMVAGGILAHPIPTDSLVTAAFLPPATP